MFSDFPWRKQRDEDGATYFYNVVEGTHVKTFDEIPLPSGWCFLDIVGVYYNDTLEKKSKHFPGQLVEMTR